MIEQSIEEAKRLTRELIAESPSRELAVVVTKLDEARMWLNEDHNLKNKSVKRQLRKVKT